MLCDSGASAGARYAFALRAEFCHECRILAGPGERLNPTLNFPAQDQPPILSATGFSKAGRQEKVYFQTARVPPSSGVNRQPPPKFSKNQGPDTMVMPTFLGGM
ncbi:hypothetical protein AR689_05395 [Arthrobacter sp. EpRS71]|nr:hypothetical protein AR689_05395 [Arthrobacter sp. EpRS71]